MTLSLVADYSIMNFGKLLEEGVSSFSVPRIDV